MWATCAPLGEIAAMGTHLPKSGEEAPMSAADNAHFLVRNPHTHPTAYVLQRKTSNFRQSRVNLLEIAKKWVISSNPTRFFGTKWKNNAK
jgi:hypothetical protein